MAPGTHAGEQVGQGIFHPPQLLPGRPGTIALSHDLAPFNFLRIPVAARDSIVNTVPGIPLLWRISPVISGQLTS